VKSSWIGIGFSLHSVPSLSNTATRSAGSTKPSPPSVVTAATKSVIAAWFGVVFHEARSCSATMPRIVRGRRPDQITPCG
jgi:hypothetical protein